MSCLRTHKPPTVRWAAFLVLVIAVCDSFLVFFLSFVAQDFLVAKLQLFIIRPRMFFAVSFSLCFIEIGIIFSPYFYTRSSFLCSGRHDLSILALNILRSTKISYQFITIKPTSKRTAFGLIVRERI